VIEYVYVALANPDESLSLQQAYSVKGYVS